MARLEWVAAGAGLAMVGHQPPLEAFADGPPSGCRSVWPDEWRPIPPVP